MSALSDAECDALAVPIARSLGLELLRDLVARHTVISHFDNLTKAYEGPIEGREQWVVAQVLHAYSVRNVHMELLHHVYKATLGLPGSETLHSAITPYLKSATLSEKQALMASRDNFFIINDLQGRLEEYQPKVCCIVGNYKLDGAVQQIQGTGFLVGPDLILTAMHVLEPLNGLRPQDVPLSYRVYFDHFTGAAISQVDPAPVGVRSVNLAASNWLVAHAQAYPLDGTLANPDASQQVAMGTQLDFALLRLDEPVGAQPASPWGGRARGWVILPGMEACDSLTMEERLLIPQHPAGAPLCLDIGRLTRHCPTRTRICYNVSTEQGSSGAPCFTRNFQPVAMHTCVYKPGNAPIAHANQATRLDTIQKLITQHLQEYSVPPPAQLWNLSTARDTYRPIIGRLALLEWIERSLKPNATARERFYVATVANGQGGKTFSWEVLEYRLLNQPLNLPIVFGKARLSVPATLEDFVRTLATSFKLPDSIHENFPARSDGDSDKIRRWASVLVPQWFAGVLDTHRLRSVDKRAAARLMADSSVLLGVPVSPEVQVLANSPTPVIEQQAVWNHAWLVIDDMKTTVLSQDIHDFLAGLAQMANSDNVTYDSLKRLRWMFLGQCPSFVDPDQASVENITADAYATGVDVLGNAIMCAAPYAQAGLIAVVIATIKAMLGALSAENLEPALQLRILQTVASDTLTRLMPRGLQK